ncbi:LytTR family transcriptional regulator [Luteimonas fraxinea]|uniref:LytTR family transcriptional regulator n=1 Tax=Luteimonas fraxinea TaxID=2901869 RepID=A0ABS8UG74_9GAMM|nr:LytTR family DNA-binding domain-containing protein [Luteimonas fraxinea]MCD9097714.1 LytTR family transcriptional regulator [Luteimonas fraxinea]MCD9127574.1 LytTR family transcriptional regulator [Luteimonas fraxinea]UHH08610.1 LytTR family transcriptional regulator [Luteimonas fraxinea]
MSARSPAPPTGAERYLAIRRPVEVGYWLITYLLSGLGNSVTTWMDVERLGLGYAAWEVASWEGSSAVALLMLVPAMVWFTARWPVHLDNWRRRLPLYAVASLVWSALHVGLMVAIRKLIYAWHGGSYVFGDAFVYEYLKDARTFLGIVVVLHGYRLLVRRLQGEASLLAAPDDDSAPVEPVERPSRFLVRKLGREFLVAADDIEWVQAAGNYANLHVRGKVYPLRSTLAELESRLDAARFLRVHRSHLVNVDRIASIEPLDSGDARIHLHDGTVVPCSRRHREPLRLAMAR